MNLLGVIHIGSALLLSGCFLNVFRISGRRTLLQALLGLGPLMGLFSGWGIIECLFPRANSSMCLLFETGAQIVLLYLLIRRKQTPALTAPDTLPMPASVEARLAEFIFFLALIVSMAGFVSALLQHPHGGWDAWTIWNYRARVLMRGGLQPDSFSPLLPWSHPDYPLLLPSAVLHLWRVAGGETTVIPCVLAFVFTFGSILLLKEFLTQRAGSLPGTLAALFLLGTRSFIRIGLDQIADIPLAFFTLSAMGTLLWAGKDENDSRRWVFAGMSLGLAAWTKNEGIAMVAVLGAMAAWESFRARKSNPLIFFLAGAGLPLFILAVFKMHWAPANDLWAPLTARSACEKLADPSRWTYLIRAMAREFWAFGLHVIPLALLFGGLQRWPQGRFPLSPMRRQACFLAAMSLIYFGVFLLSPHDLVWHTHTATSRLIAHLWPIALLMLFAGSLAD